jgi:hypothetical protein
MAVGRFVGAGGVVLWLLATLAACPVPRAAAGEADQPAAQGGKGFELKDEPGKHLDLLFDGRKVTRFMYAHDFSTKERRFETYKPFTHVFASKGERLITNDHGDPFPHHRGIFIGWNRTTLADGKTRYDFWHMPNVCQRIERFTAQEASPAFGRMVALIRWEDPKEKPVILEEREIKVWRPTEAGLLMDFVSTLRSQQGEVVLDGDPEHAGCQFRAHSDLGQLYKKMKPPEIQAQGKDTRYLCPAGMDPRKTLDMPWAAVSFVLGEARFHVAFLNHPDNPKGTRFSAYRDYARFGAFAKATLKPDQPLVFRYRLLVREGEKALAADEAQRLYDEFAKR